MSLKRIITVSGWAASSEIMAQLTRTIASPEHIQHTSVSELLAMNNEGSMSPYAEALASIINASDTPVTIIAWSMGAIVALESAIDTNLNVDRMVLISPTTRFCAASDYPFGVAVARIRAMQAALAVNPKKTIQAFLNDVAFPYNFSEATIGDRLNAALGIGVTTLTHGLIYLRNTDLRNTAAQITIPILALHGKQDKIIPCQAAEQLVDILPSSELVTFENAGHDLLTQHQELLVPHIKKFLA